MKYLPLILLLACTPIDILDNKSDAELRKEFKAELLTMRSTIDSALQHIEILDSNDAFQQRRLDNIPYYGAGNDSAKFLIGKYNQQIIK